MPHAFYATRLSDKLSKTPEGFLIARDVVLGRTGFQTYNVRDLPKKLADELGVDTSDPSAEIDLYRPEDEVFDRATIASFEGKPVTDNHPGDGFVDPNNFNDYARGHIQNVRRGSKPLDSGEWPLMGDIMITVDSLIRKVEGGLRELSAGYDYSLARDGDTLLQTGIRGNHVALVPKGRAGPEARIYDAAPDHGGEIKTTKKETANVPNVATKQPTETNWFRRVFGLGLRAMAQDESTSPEELAEAASAVSDEEGPPNPAGYNDLPAFKRSQEENGKRRAAGQKIQSSTFPSNDRRGRDEDPDDENEPTGEDRHADDRRADDRRADDRRADDRSARDRKAGDRRGRDEWPPAKSGGPGGEQAPAGESSGDRRGADHRAHMHSTLDRILDEMLPAEEEGEQEGSSEDADMQELRQLLNEYMGEEAGEPEHADDNSGGEQAEVIEPPNANSESSGSTLADRRASDRSRANDTAEFDFLKRMKRLAIKANDQAGVRDITARMQRFTRVSRPLPAGTGYGGFQAAAGRSRAGDSTLAVAQADPKKLQATYDLMLKGKKVEEGN